MKFLTLIRSYFTLSVVECMCRCGLEFHAVDSLKVCLVHFAMPGLRDVREKLLLSYLDDEIDDIEFCLFVLVRLFSQYLDTQRVIHVRSPLNKLLGFLNFCLFVADIRHHVLAVHMHTNKLKSRYHSSHTRT